MKKAKNLRLPPYVMLCLVAIVMSFAIAKVYELTKDTIEAAALQAQAEARGAVMAEAVSMAELAPEEGAPVDYCYEAYDAEGNVIGYVSQITVIGFGGEIEVTVGMDMTGTITAISVGGSDFSETSGLGARTREPAFTQQFAGASGMLVLKQNIDSVTGASISSGAVVSGVNKALDYMTALLPEGAVAADVEEIELTQEQVETLLPGAENLTWMGGGSGITGWWRADNGYIVRATGFGEGPIAVTMGFDNDGVVTGVIIGDENFMETEGRGDGVLAEWYQTQFIGLRGALAYGEGIDSISGATVTSDATLAAVNACMTFDPADPGTAAPVGELPAADAVTEASVMEEASGETSADAVTEASVVAEEASLAEEPDAVSEASVDEEEPPTAEPVDAVTEASVTEEEEAPAATPAPVIGEPVDAVTEASVTEEEEAPAATPAPVIGEPVDAVTEASVTEEEEAPAATPARPGWSGAASWADWLRSRERVPTAVDAVTEASVTE